MSFSKILTIYLLILIAFPTCAPNLQAEQEIYIRLNQLGFSKDDIKTAVVLSKVKLDGTTAEVINNKTNKEIFSVALQNSIGKYGSFSHTYNVDLSKLKDTGEYVIEIGNKRSYPFTIKDDVYNGLAGSLLDFFKVQRCGYTDPFLHGICHIADATCIISGKDTVRQNIDLTGGWHDAGDYVKFLNTTAYATYMLLFSYDFNPEKFSFDRNNNGAPDILEEAKIGLDWMLRCNFEKYKLITQVQDLRDHDVGWRMPEADPLTYDRSAFIGMGKNLIGIFSATMALASRIWKDKFYYKEFADKCLNAAENLYSIRNRVQDVDSSGTGMYIDNVFKGKLSLGAVELFIATGKKNYLDDAIAYADSAGSDFWWSWGNINSIAHYRLSSYDMRFTDFIKNNLEEFNKKKKNDLFGKGTTLTWGTNNTLLGITLQNILWKRLTNDSSYDTVASHQKDFVLGRNPWGISFIYGYGMNYSKNFHHQIAKIKGNLPGGFAAGPATVEFLKAYNIQYEKKDNYAEFQTNEVYYRDDRMDYITNEPTITGNATAIFVFGNISK